MVEKIRKHAAILIFLCAIIFFYSPFFFSVFRGDVRIPLPTDTIVGLYHPYRDFYSHNYPRGIPFKNFLITDPVRQTYVWKELVFDGWKNLKIPSWNPYEMTGKPLISNFQSGAFYPLNILLFFGSFEIVWSVLIVLQTLLLGVFTYLYLRNLKLDTVPSVIGSAAFTFSGFSISWLEWGNVIHTALWLPLALLAIDKFFAEVKNRKFLFGKVSMQLVWLLVFIASLIASFLAGHLQIFFYLYITTTAYFVLRLTERKLNPRTLLFFVLANALFILATIFQWLPTLTFITHSARGIDQNLIESAGWFLPYRHLIQFLAPDFFGNPATLNYWGTWNYGELTGYIGIMPLIFALCAYYKRSRTVYFFTFILLLSLLFGLPTIVGKVPFLLHLPLLSTAQPTRLVFLIVFSLCVLSAFGASYVLKKSTLSIRTVLPLFITGGIFSLLWIIVLLGSHSFFESSENILVAQRNLIFPTIIFILVCILLIAGIIMKKQKTKEAIAILVILLVQFDLLRFSQKFTTFGSTKYLYPETSTLKLLQQDKGVFRVAVLDRRIMPPNFFTHYKIQTIEGYDPLYLKSYAEFIVALERNKPDISPPYGFNRIITPHNYDSQLFDFLNTKYVLSFEELSSPKLMKIHEEGETKIYRNTLAFERAYFVNKVVYSKNPVQAIFTNNLKEAAIIGSDKDFERVVSVGRVEITKYTDDEVFLSTMNEGDGFLVLSDAFYPTWKVFVDGVEGKIIQTNLSFRGVFIPNGRHTIIFKNNLF